MKMLCTEPAPPAGLWLGTKALQLPSTCRDWRRLLEPVKIVCFKEQILFLAREPRDFA